MVDYRVRVEGDAAATLAALIASLHGHGFRTARTFDLHAARLSGAQCLCPHHDTEHCDCELSVMLVYRPGGAPAGLPGVIVAHHHAGVTWLDLLPLPWSDRVAADWRARITDSMVATVFAGDPAEREPA